ncbi:M60 family metallopeptidase [Chitinophaga niabensis]|uniref:Peptidase M60, enhancin and enhancin-like n=1 Tax=Chitinophaga niabensis TaxID=536979 RepID=A0A1N6DNA2_9BACT|nr:M60 family metallopeptidase [Chitinophaga niabensis]SIN72143.1 Peptidase M60, enhancin and enhancin-like [Chitinophaga niabensis]
MIKYATLTSAMMVIAMLSHAQDAATVVISPDQPLSAKNTDLRKQVYEWSKAQLNSDDYKTVKAHPSAAVFPGKIKEGATPVTKTVHITHNKISDTLVPVVSRVNYAQPWNDNLYSTGLYAAPGAYIEVTVPKELLDKGIGIQVGAHSDNLNQWVAGKEDWRRMPLIVRKQELKAATTKIASPFGGLIYVTTSPRKDSWAGDVKIGHAIEAPLYRAGITTPEEWKAQLQNNKAPWGELATEKVVLTIPDSVLQQVTDPAYVMKIWDLIIGGEAELAQIPQPYYRPQRMVIDEHIGGGFMHSGYPVMIHHSPSRRMLSADVIADPLKLMVGSKGGANWGFFHEIGHNMQNLDWVFGGTTEVSCNFFSLYMFDRLLGGRDDAHTGISNKETQDMMKKYFGEGADYETWKKNPFLGLIMFRQLQEAFGWETFKKFFRECHTLAAIDKAGTYAKTDVQKRDLWAGLFSRAAGRNVAPFFEKWGIPISDAVKKDLSSLPEWMPYNFPPQQ